MKMFDGNIITFGNKNLFIINKNDRRWHIISQNKVIGRVYVYERKFVLLTQLKLSKRQQHHAEIVRFFLTENGFKEL